MSATVSTDWGMDNAPAPRKYMTTDEVADYFRTAASTVRLAPHRPRPEVLQGRQAGPLRHGSGRAVGRRAGPGSVRQGGPS